jgi:hypothetical protein
MASYATWDTNTSRYVLGPVLQCAQEIFPKNKTFNPTFELTYWRWALETAQHGANASACRARKNGTTF